MGVDRAREDMPFALSRWGSSALASPILKVNLIIMDLQEGAHLVNVNPRRWVARGYDDRRRGRIDRGCDDPRLKRSL